MRWQNKGHEFDHVYKNLAEKSGFWLFGAGMYGEAMHKELETPQEDPQKRPVLVQHRLFFPCGGRS